MGQEKIGRNRKRIEEKSAEVIIRSKKPTTWNIKDPYSIGMDGDEVPWKYGGNIARENGRNKQRKEETSDEGIIEVIGRTKSGKAPDHVIRNTYLDVNNKK